MPALSSTMSEGKIVSWLKQPGDEVKKGEAVLVVESDKADMDVECFHSGTLATVLLPAGSSAPVGETLALVAETAAEVEELQKEKMYIVWESYHYRAWIRGIGICLALAQPKLDPLAWIIKHCRQVPLSAWDAEENYKTFLTAGCAAQHWFLVGLNTVETLGKHWKTSQCLEEEVRMVRN